MVDGQGKMRNHQHSVLAILASWHQANKYYKIIIKIKTGAREGLTESSLVVNYNSAHR